MHANERTAGYENRTLHQTHPLLRRPTLTRPMHIGFLVHKPLPDREADSEQIVNTAAALANRGHDVSLLMPGRRRAARVTAGEIARYYGTNSSLRVRTVPARFRRELPMSLAHAWSALDRELRERCDVVVTRRFESVVLGLNRGFRMAYDHYRPWPRTVPILRPLFRWIINHPRFAGAFLHSPYARDSYIDLKVPASRVTLAYNGWLPERLLPRLTKEEARLSLGLDFARTDTEGGRDLFGLADAFEHDPVLGWGGCEVKSRESIMAGVAEENRQRIAAILSATGLVLVLVGIGIVVYHYQGIPSGPASRAVVRPGPAPGSGRPG